MTEQLNEPEFPTQLQIDKAEIARLRTENASLRQSIADLIPLAQHQEYPQGDDLAVIRARGLLK